MSDNLKDVYDCRDGSFPFDGATAICDWAVREGFDLRDAYRMEIRLLDTLFARVFEYDQTKGGLRFLDPATNDIAKRPPYDVVISSLPPIPPAGHHETGDTT